MSSGEVSSSVRGQVDGIVADEIVGWIANLEDPTSLAPFVVECSDTGEAQWFRPHCFRGDVTLTLGQQGIFGFAVPINTLPNHWRSISVKSVSGELLPNGRLTLPARNLDTRNDDSLDIFIHIQKTAGTSLRAALEQSVPASRRCFLYLHFPGMIARQFVSLPLKQRWQFQLLMGHFYFGVGRLVGKPCRHFTFLREPSARLRSHYFHFQRMLARNPDAPPLPAPLETIVNEGLTEIFDNYQVRLISGLGKDHVPVGQVSESDLELAVANIENYFGFVGLVERIESDAAIMFKKMNLPPMALDQLNVGPPPATSTDGIDWAAANDRNKYDFKLYELVRTHKISPARL